MPRSRPAYRSTSTSTPCATHLLEDGTNIRLIQALLGHRSLTSTQVYTHVAQTNIHQTTSPLDRVPNSE
jgi:integrase